MLKQVTYVLATCSRRLKYNIHNSVNPPIPKHRASLQCAPLKQRKCSNVPEWNKHNYTRLWSYTPNLHELLLIRHFTCDQLYPAGFSWINIFFSVTQDNHKACKDHRSVHFINGPALSSGLQQSVMNCASFTAVSRHASRPRSITQKCVRLQNQFNHSMHLSNHRTYMSPALKFKPLQLPHTTYLR
jgi:hypothetical protein